MEPLDSPIRKLLLKYGQYQAIANELGVTIQNVRYWVMSDFIPPEHWRAVCRLLGITIDELLDHAEARARRKRRRRE